MWSWANLPSLPEWIRPRAPEPTSRRRSKAALWITAINLILSLLFAVATIWWYQNQMALLRATCNPVRLPTRTSAGSTHFPAPPTVDYLSLLGALED